MEIEVEGKRQEAIKLIYGERDVLYLSIHSLHKVTKYNGKDGKPPQIYKLGSAAWKKLKQKTKTKIWVSKRPSNAVPPTLFHKNQITLQVKLISLMK